MNLTPNLFRLTLIEVSNVLNLTLVLLLFLIQFYFEKPCSQTMVLIGITNITCHSDIRVSQLIMNSLSLPQKIQTSSIPQCSQIEDNIFTNFNIVLINNVIIPMEMRHKRVQPLLS